MKSKKNKLKISKQVETNKEVETKKVFNVAVVTNGKYEVRRYSVEDHGENFAELANEFASKKGYQVELE